MKIFITLLLFCYTQNIFTQDSKLKYSNDWNYKLTLIEKEFDAFSGIGSYPDCKSIKDCLVYYFARSDSKIEKALERKLKEIAVEFIKNNQVLILTYGTNGEGGLGLENLDKKTKKFEYIFVTVSISCQVGRIPDAIAIFNEESFEYLDSKYGNEWRVSLEKVLTKKGLLSSIIISNDRK